MGSTGRLYIWLALLLAAVVVVVWACRTQGSGDLREQLKEAEQQLTSQQAKVAQLTEDLSAEEAGASSLEEALSTEKETGSLLSSLLSQALDKSNKLSQQIAGLQARLGDPTPTPTPTPPGVPAPTPSGTPAPTPAGFPTPTPIGTPSPTSTPSPTPLPPPTGDAVALARQAVVLVKSSVAEGSGFIFDPKGLVLTNAHVVGEDTWVTVVTGDAVPMLGDVVGRHILMDVAVIQLRTQDQMPALALGDSSPASFRDEVMFLGYPRGSLLGQGATVTTGGFYLQRSIREVSYLQIDASLTPGYSGGPLINSAGEAIGIYTDRLFQPGAGHTQSTAFVIAINPAKGVITALSAGRVTPTPLPTTTPTRETPYRNVAWGYALRLPPGWQTEESRLDTVLLWSSEPAIGGEVFSQLATDYTAESWTDFLLDAIRSRATTFEQLSRSPMVLAVGVPGARVLYTATFPSYEAPLTVRMVTAITMDRNFVLQVFAEESAWEEHLPRLETMASSFMPTP